KFCELTDCPELTDNPDYVTNEQRVLNRTSLIPLVAKYMKKHTTDWWVDKLKALGVPCGRVNTIEQVFNHEQIKHRNLVKEVPDSNGKLIKTIGSPINLSETPLQYHSASPNLSQHGVEILSGELGYSDRKIQQLIKSGVVG
ncbi:MAG: CoA transferase, partial [Gammaproteobacteria bacterium]